MATPNRSRPGPGIWADHPISTRHEAPEDVVTSSYSLSRMVSAGQIPAERFEQFRQRTGLAEYFWRMTFWRGSSRRGQRASYHLKRADGFVVLMHGWDGSGLIWEDLPAQICTRHPGLICLTPDVNGFGGSPFIEAELPRVSDCTPRANMAAVEAWLQMIQLHQPGTNQVFTFVGHSMSGASLFYKSAVDWNSSQVARLSLAPALLNNDLMKKGFYQLMGLGIGAGWQYGLLDRLKDKMATSVVQALISGASQAVKREHERVFATTAKGTLAQSFFAMGLGSEEPISQRSWPRFRVLFGHRDRLVTLNVALELMAQLGLQSENVRVMLGDHYFFSVANKTRRLHGPNRTAVLDEILALHEACLA